MLPLPVSVDTELCDVTYTCDDCEVPRSLAGTAQAFYGTVAIGGTTALLTMVSGWLFSRFGPYGFWGMASLCCAALPIIWSLRSSLSNSAE